MRETRGEIEDLWRDARGDPHGEPDRPTDQACKPQASRGMLLRCCDRRTLGRTAQRVDDRYRPLQALQRHVRPSDRRPGAAAGGDVDAGARSGKHTAARFGGEEFAILLPESSRPTRVPSPSGPPDVMGRELVKRSTGEALGRVTISVGVASFMEGDTAALLLERADRCLLAAKRAGRNRVRRDRSEDRARRRLGGSWPRLTAASGQSAPEPCARLVPAVETSHAPAALGLRPKPLGIDRRERNRLAAAAGRGLVRIVEYELRRELRGREVHLRSEQEQHRLRVDQDGNALFLDDFIAGRRRRHIDRV